MRRILWLSLILLVSGCAPYALVGGNITEPDNFQVELPQGWRKHDLAADQNPVSRSIVAELQQRRDLTTDVIRITKDGLTLQQIAIGRLAIDKALPHTKRQFADKMLPQEAAEVVADDIQSNPNVINQQIIESTPAEIGGYHGFKLLYTYQSKSKLKLRGTYYGALTGNWYYYVLYEAPDGYYYAKDYPAFERVKETFKILGK